MLKATLKSFFYKEQPYVAPLDHRWGFS